MNPSEKAGVIEKTLQKIKAARNIDT